MRTMCERRSESRLNTVTMNNRWIKCLTQYISCTSRYIDMSAVVRSGSTRHAHKLAANNGLDFLSVPFVCYFRQIWPLCMWRNRSWFSEISGVEKLRIMIVATQRTPRALIILPADRRKESSLKEPATKSGIGHVSCSPHSPQAAWSAGAPSKSMDRVGFVSLVRKNTKFII